MSEQNEWFKHLIEYLNLQRYWSAMTFGHGLRTMGLIKHIQEELDEIRADPTDVYEWIDVVILALDGAWRAGYTAEEVVDALVKKQQVNFQRKWLPGPEDESYKRIRDVVTEVDNES